MLAGAAGGSRQRRARIAAARTKTPSTTTTTTTKTGGKAPTRSAASYEPGEDARLYLGRWATLAWLFWPTWPTWLEVHVFLVKRLSPLRFATALLSLRRTLAPSPRSPDAIRSSYRHFTSILDMCSLILLSLLYCGFQIVLLQNFIRQLCFIPDRFVKTNNRGLNLSNIIKFVISFIKQ